MRANRLRVLLIAAVALMAFVAVPVTHARQAARASAQADINGFKVGDVVQVGTAFGWTDATIVAIAGNDYQVRLGADIIVRKTYPAELHRKGPYTDRDRAVGLYALKDIVQVNIQGKGWIEGEVTTTSGMEYQVTLPGNNTAWASGAQIRYVRTPGPVVIKAGVPPKPGFVSCAGKIEGRYAPTGGLGGLTIVFKAGKATVSLGFGDDETLECWTLKDKIILRTPGSPDEDMPLDINDDGTIQTPFGELKKKGGG